MEGEMKRRLNEREREMVEMQWDGKGGKGGKWRDVTRKGKNEQRGKEMVKKGNKG